MQKRGTLPIFYLSGFERNWDETGNFLETNKKSTWKWMAKEEDRPPFLLGIPYFQGRTGYVSFGECDNKTLFPGIYQKYAEVRSFWCVEKISRKKNTAFHPSITTFKKKGPKGYHGSCEAHPTPPSLRCRWAISTRQSGSPTQMGRLENFLGRWKKFPMVK